MPVLENKIDFAVIFSVKNANPNGDPLNGNRPRENYDGYGEVSDVCLKRKIRNRWQDEGLNIFVQSSDRVVDGYKSLKDRYEAMIKEKDYEKCYKAACKKWIDVRGFGQVFAYKGKTKNANGVSIGIRGPISIQSAISVQPIVVDSIQITKSVIGNDTSDTMGTKHRVPYGVYVTYGSINCQLAEKTGFTEEDAKHLHAALTTLFENDISSARPAGSMEVKRVYWWKHNCKSGQYASAKVHRSLRILASDDARCWEDYSIEYTPLKDLEPDIYSAEE